MAMQRFFIAICFLLTSIYSSTAQLTIEIQDAETCTNTIDVPIIVQEAVSLTSLQFTLEWDDSGLSFNSVSTPLSPTPAYGPNGGMPLDNILTVVYSNSTINGQSFAAGDTIMTLNFTVTGTPGSTYAVGFYTGNNPNYPGSFATGSLFAPILPLTTLDGSVIVLSNSPTFIGCPSDISENVNPGICGANVSWVIPTVEDCDNNANPPVEANGFNPGDFFNVGTTTITYTVSDASGNTDVCTFDITVSDNENPTLTCTNTDINVSVPLGTTSIVVNDPQLVPTFDDNCPGESLFYMLANGANTSSGSGDADGEVFFTGTTVVTYTVTDAAGNTAECMFNVVVTESNATPITLEIGQVDAECCNSTIDVPIIIQEDANLSSLQFTIYWDGAGLTYNGITSVFDPLFLGPNSGGPLGDTLSVVWSGSNINGDPVSAGDILFTISFDVSSCVAGDFFPVVFYDGTNQFYPEAAASGANFLSIPVLEVNGGVTIVDTAPPTITCPSNTTISCDASTDPSNTGTATATDVCDTNPSVTSSDVNNLTGCNNTGTITRTWTATDAAGNSTNCTQIITIEDNTPPTFTAPGPVTINCEDSPTDLLLTGDVTDEADNCATTTLEATFTDDNTGLTGCNGTGIITRTWSLTDGCNTAPTQTQIITVVDNTPPTFTAPAAVTINCEDSPTDLLITGDVTDEADNCATTNLEATFTDDNSGLTGCNGTGTITRTWSLTDGCNTAPTQTQTITVVDNTSPTFTAPPAVTINCEDSPTDLTITGDVTDEMDNCATGLQATFTDDNSGLTGCNGAGTITRTWSLTDGCNTAVTQTQTITVVDNTLPTFTVPVAVTINCEDSPTDLAITGDVTDEADNCATGIQATFTDDNSGLTGCNGTGQIIRTWSLTDGCNTPVTQTQTITVVDNTDPTFTVPADISLNCTEDYTDLTLTGDVTDEGDNCSTGLMAVFTDALSGTSGCGGPSVVTRTWTVTDDCGNSFTQTQIINLIDTSPPTFTVPPAVTINCDDDPNDLSLTGDVTDEASNCAANPQATFVDNNNGLTGCNGTGQIVRIWTLDDGCSGVVSQNQIITVVDNTDPTFTAPANLTINCEDDVNDLTITGDVTDEADNCSINLNATFTDNTNGLTGCNSTGQFVRTWTLTDDCGNATTANQIITVVDNTNPTFTVPPAVTLNCEDNFNDLSLTGDVLDELDNCDVSLDATFTDDNSGLTGCNGTGQIIRTWTLTDDCGNSATGTQIITIVDNTNPTFTVPANITINCNLDYLDLANTGDASNENDNCSINLQATFTDVESGLTGCNTPSEVIRTWTLTDDCGNTTTGTQIIILVDNDPPTFTVPPTVIINCEDDPTDLTLTGDVTDEMSDCATNPQATFMDDLSGLTGCNGTGVITRTWTLDDGCSSVVIQTQIISVVDVTAPSFTVPAAVTISCEADETDLLLTGNVTNETDNCDDNLEVTFTDNTDGLVGCSGTGEIIRTWIVTDECMNSSTQTQTITIEDNTPPTFTAPAAVTINCEDDPADLTITGDVTDEADNCDLTLDATFVDDNSGLTDCNGTGIITRTWTATDDCDNATSQTQIITVVDNTAPTFTVPAAITINCNEDYTDLAITGDVTDEADNCSTNLMATFTDVTSGTSACGGPAEVLRTWTLTDDCGNTTTLEQVITLVDGDPPTFTVPPAVTLNCEDDPSDLTLTGDVTDEMSICNTTAQATFSDDLSGLTGCSGTGTIIRTWTLDDGCSVIVVKIQNITIVDDTDPTFTVPVAVTLSCEDDATSLALTGDVTDEADNCTTGLDAVFTDDNSGLTGCNGTGTIVRTWTLTDDCGNVLTQSQTITIVDNAAPTFTVPADVTLNCDQDPTNLGLTGDVANEADNCSTGLQATFTDANSGNTNCNTPSEIIRTWTLTDDCGNTVSLDQTITLIDITNNPSTFTAPADITINCEDDATDLTLTGDVTDEVSNCNPTAQATFSDDLSGLTGCNGTGTIIRTWTLDDGCSAIVTHTQTITLVDTAAPSFTSPAAVTISCENDPNNLTLTGDVTNEADNCSVGLEATYTDDLSGLTGCNGTGLIVRTWTLTDDCGNSSSGLQAISVVDNTPPTFTVPPGITLNCAQYPLDLAVVGDVINEADNCSTGLEATFTDVETGTTACGNPSQIVRTWVLVDDCGNTLSLEQIIKLVNGNPPTFTVPTDVTLNCDDDPTDLTLTGDVIDEMSDCATNVEATYVDDLSALNGCNGSGVIVRTWTVDDGCSGSVSFNQLITVVDNTAPVAGCQNVTIALDENGVAILTVDQVESGSSDNCQDAASLNYSLSQTNFDCSHLGANTVTLTVTDACGNEATCFATVTLIDLISPEITCPSSDLTVNADVGSCEASGIWMPATGFDNCAGVIVTSSHNNNSTFPVGSTVVTHTATDASGNSATCTYTITVIDEEDPVLSCDTGVLQYTNIGNCEAVVSWDDITASDNCMNGLTISSSHNSGDVFMIGVTTTVTYEVVDQSGNTATCSFDINPIDEDGPIVTNCPSDITLSAQGVNCEAVHTWDALQATDNCSDVITSCDIVSGTSFPIGSTIVTCTATDGSGNSTTCSFIVTVEDDVAPVASCFADVELQIDGTVLSDPDGIIVDAVPNGDCSGLVVTYTDPTATDNCSATINIANVLNPSGSTLVQGANAVEYSFTDEAGNVSNCNWIIDVVPFAQSAINIDPVNGTTFCEGDDLLLVGTGIAGIYTWTDPDNNTTTNDTLSAEGITLAGSGIYTLTVELDSGCSVSNDIDVVVNEMPSLSAESNSPICDGSLFIETMLDPDSPDVTYSWIGPCGFVSDSANVDLEGLTPDCDGLYTLIAETEEGCTVTITQPVASIEFTTPLLTSGCDTVICLTEGCILLGTDYSVFSPDSYNWIAPQNGGLPANTNQSGIQINPTEPGEYTYQYSVSIGGCETDTATTTVIIVDSPEVNDDFFETDYQIAVEDFIVTDNDVVFGELAGDLNIIALPSNGTLQMNEDGEFTYTPESGFIGVDFFLYRICYNCDIEQCDTARVEIRVNFEGDCEVPNIITSNGDGINDVLEITCLETDDFPESEIIVFNQWGDRVFSASPYMNDWSGTRDGEDGKDLPDGTYYFIFKESPDAAPKKGYVMIWR